MWPCLDLQSSAQPQLTALHSNASSSFLLFSLWFLLSFVCLCPSFFVLPIYFGSVHTAPEKFENAAFFLRLVLPSQRFWKGYSSWRNLIYLAKISLNTNCLIVGIWKFSPAIMWTENIWCILKWKWPYGYSIVCFIHWLNSPSLFSQNNVNRSDQIP